MSNIEKVKDIVPYTQYVASAGQTIFVYPFPIFDDGDIAVEQNGTLLTLSTDYTVSGVAAEDGGNITLTSGANAGDILTIYRDMALERLIDYQQNGDFLANTVNRDYDRLWLAMQQLQGGASNGEGVGRAWRAAPGDSLTAQELIIADEATRSGRFVGFDSNGKFTYSSPAISSDPSQIYSDVLTMQNDNNPKVGEFVRTVGYTTPGDGGGNDYEIVAAGTGTDDGGSFIDLPGSGLQARGLFPGGRIVADQFGDPNDTSINSAIEYASTLGGGARNGGTVDLLAKIYTISGPIIIPQGVFLKGAGQMATSIIKSVQSDDYWMVESKDFDTLSGSNLWLEQDGVPTGFGIFDLTLYGLGNPPISSSTRGGLRFYGKRYYVERVIIQNVDGDGAWLQCANAGGQFQWRDLPEGRIDQLYVFSAGRDGIVYEGPHDGANGVLIASSCHRDGVIFKRTATTSATCEVDLIHSYGNAGRGVVVDSPMHFGTLIGESNDAEGIVFVNGFNSKVDWLQAYSNCGVSGSYQVDIQSGSNNTIIAGLQMSGASGTDIGGINNAAQEVQIDNIKIQMSGAGIGINNTASHCSFEGIIAGFSSTGGTGLKLVGGAFSHYDLDIRECDVVIDTTGDYLRSDFLIKGFSSAVSSTWLNAPTLSQRQELNVVFNYRVGTNSFLSKFRHHDNTTVDITAVGTYTITVPHKLFTTPNASDVSVDLTYTGANTNWRINGPYFVMADSTNITVQLDVTTSITGPATNPGVSIGINL